MNYPILTLNTNRIDGMSRLCSRRGDDDGEVEDHPRPLRVVDQEESQAVEKDDWTLSVFLKKVNQLDKP